MTAAHRGDRSKPTNVDAADGDGVHGPGGAMDGVRVSLCPPADRVESVELLGRRTPVATRTHVQQEVATSARGFAERTEQFVGGAVVAVVGVPTPAVIDRHARLPATRWGGVGDELLGCLEVAMAREPIVDDQLGELTVEVTAEYPGLFLGRLGRRQTQ